MTTKFTVYLLTNTITQKQYVGVTSTTIPRRWVHHVSRSRDENCQWKLPRAIRKYGTECWKKEAICSAVGVDNTRELERFFIAEYNTYIDGYNSTLGGDLHTEYSHAPKWTPERKAAMSELHRGKSYHPGKSGADHPMWGKKGTMTGKQHTEEAKQKMKDAYACNPTRRLALGKLTSKAVSYRGIPFASKTEAVRVLGFTNIVALNQWMDVDQTTGELSWKSDARPRKWVEPTPQQPMQD